MKKIFFILVFMALISLVLFSGCAQKDDGATGTTTKTTEKPTTTSAGGSSDVSKEELDDLKKGIEGLEPEDLGGLSDK